MKKKLTAAQRHRIAMESLHSFKAAWDNLSARVKALEDAQTKERVLRKQNINEIYGKFGGTKRWIVNHTFQCVGVNNTNCTQCGNPREEHVY